MGCTAHATFEAANGMVVRQLKLYEGDRLASESMVLTSVP